MFGLKADPSEFLILGTTDKFDSEKFFDVYSELVEQSTSEDSEFLALKEIFEMASNEYANDDETETYLTLMLKDDEFIQDLIDNNILPRADYSKFVDAFEKTLFDNTEFKFDLLRFFLEFIRHNETNEKSAVLQQLLDRIQDQSAEFFESIGSDLADNLTEDIVNNLSIAFEEPQKSVADKETKKNEEKKDEKKEEFSVSLYRSDELLSQYSFFEDDFQFIQDPKEFELLIKQYPEILSEDTLTPNVESPYIDPVYFEGGCPKKRRSR